MMDSASLVVTALILLTIILQIVCIVQVLDIKKNRKSEAEEEKPQVSEQRDFRRQREPENRFGRRSPQEHKPRPAPAQGQGQSQSQNGDQLERSLRDINLRLKNADKDQEKERQRIKDTISPSSSPSSPRRFDNQKPRERGDHFRRNDRSRQDYQQNRSGEGSRGPREDRPPSRNQFENRDRRPQGNVQQNQSPAQAAFPAAPVSAPAPAAAPIPAAPIVPIMEAAAPVMEKAPVEVVEASIQVQESRGDLQHGRKFPVKRRALNLEEGQSEEGESAPQQAADNTPAASEEKQFSDQPQERGMEANGSRASKSADEAGESYASGPISFGR